MPSLTSDQTISVIRNTELISSAWDISQMSRSKVLSAAESAGFQLVTDFGELVEPNTTVEPNSFYLSPDARGSDLVFVKKIANNRQSAIFDLDSYLLFIDKRGKAYTNLGLVEGNPCDGALTALRMHSLDRLLWTWAWINSKLRSPWQEALEASSRAGILGNLGRLELLVPRTPKSNDDALLELRSLAQLVNSQIASEEEERSTYSLMKLKTGSAWQLRNYARAIDNVPRKLLGSMISSVVVGKTLRSDVTSGIPSTGGKWLATGSSNLFHDPNADNLVLAEPGDVVTPSIGTLSQARVAKQVMALSNGHYAISPNFDVDPESISSFLNSRDAQKQRLQAVQSQIIPRLNRKDLLRFEFHESIDVFAIIQKIVSRVMAV